MHTQIHLAALLVLLASVSPVSSGQALRTDEQLFAHDRVVAIRGGYVPALSAAAKRLEAIACSTDATSALEHLYEGASPEGKVLVLIGLAHVDHERYVVLRRRFATELVPRRGTTDGGDEMVADEFDDLTGSCIPTRMSKGAVLEAIDNGSLGGLIPWKCPPDARPN